jgi:rare lipoprotein A
VKNTKLTRPWTQAQTVALVLALVFTTACAGGRLVARTSGQTGIASWYGADFHGRPTSNREIYNMYEMTAAHPTLPFGTRVMVTNLDNGRAAEVRINDRGPFMKKRIIDLSYAAARLLDMVGSGTAPVRLEILDGAARASGRRYIIQIGSFVDKENARELKAKLGNRYGEAFISPTNCSGRNYYRVRFRADEPSETERLAARLSSAGFPVLICESD